ncbi:hypothetical protein BDK51DRAFT_47831 [Blyttiomyces helicus]|uniref:F-box domain-containing protein n=1 Tax=Blyttiomyces helicus TaxID=388810 RepID=A0A4P9W671_9FUNG|nr:hypothetical protein BDK51DRAFT_47831 [Blyttiomyces helicus]|eukprot:RKO85606.1 hypothetical protein BDK51DRAFT_47831 [Blyttiomyces helicus]
MPSLPPTIASLPPELLLPIFRCLNDPASLARCERVCPRWNKLLQGSVRDQAWEPVIAPLLPPQTDLTDVPLLGNERSLKDVYLTRLVVARGLVRGAERGFQGVYAGEATLVQPGARLPPHETQLVTRSYCNPLDHPYSNAGEIVPAFTGDTFLVIAEDMDHDVVSYAFMNTARSPSTADTSSCSPASSTYNPLGGGRWHAAGQTVDHIRTPWLASCSGGLHPSFSLWDQRRCDQSSLDFDIAGRIFGPTLHGLNLLFSTEDAVELWVLPAPQGSEESDPAPHPLPPPSRRWIHKTPHSFPSTAISDTLVAALTSDYETESEIHILSVRTGAHLLTLPLSGISNSGACALILTRFHVLVHHEVPRDTEDENGSFVENRITVFDLAGSATRIASFHARCGALLPPNDIHMSLCAGADERCFGFFTVCNTIVALEPCPRGGDALVRWWTPPRLESRLPRAGFYELYRSADLHMASTRVAWHDMSALVALVPLVREDGVEGAAGFGGDGMHAEEDEGEGGDEAEARSIGRRHRDGVDNWVWRLAAPELRDP